MKWLSALLFLIVSSHSFARDAGDTVIRGIHINFIYDKTIFPDFWKISPINAEGEGIESDEIERCKQIVKNALEKYPYLMLDKELKTVFFLKAMKFYDVGYGGTNSTDALYLANNGNTNGYTDLYLEQTFHHEFSSILYRNHPSYFREEEWYAANSPDFAYTDPENGVGAIRDNHSSQVFDTVLCVKGILTEYGSSGIENDLNTFAQNIFSPSTGFWDIVDKYPRIQKKLKLIVSFYHRIHPVFTMDYFRNLATKEH